VYSPTASGPSKLPLMGGGLGGDGGANAGLPCVVMGASSGLPGGAASSKRRHLGLHTFHIILQSKHGSIDESQSM
jgi:hypothetical protein